MESREVQEFSSDSLVIENDDSTQEDKYLTFSLGEEEYGIGIKDVMEIIGIQHITNVPDMPIYIKGVINLRGKIIPVMDVRLRFGMELKGYNERTSIIVVNIHDTDVGLIVDSVSEVLDIHRKNIEFPAQFEDGSSRNYIKAFGKVENSVKILLNTQMLLNKTELTEITNKEN